MKLYARDLLGGGNQYIGQIAGIKDKKFTFKGVINRGTEQGELHSLSIDVPRGLYEIRHVIPEMGYVYIGSHQINLKKEQAIEIAEGLNSGFDLSKLQAFGDQLYITNWKYQQNEEKKGELKAQIKVDIETRLEDASLEVLQEIQARLKTV